ADRAVRLIEIPELALESTAPSRNACRNGTADERPVLVLDDVPDFRRQPAVGNRARLPGERRVEPRAVHFVGLHLHEFLAAILEYALAIRRDRALHRFDERRQARFTV